MAPLCREFGISRVTGYRIFNRYRECGLDALYDRSRAPYRQANRLPFQIERTIVGIKREHKSRAPFPTLPMCPGPWATCSQMSLCQPKSMRKKWRLRWTPPQRL